MNLSGGVTFYPEVESTQSEAKKSLSGVHWTMNQTSGKGRFDRTWYSEPSSSLAISIAFPNYRGFAKPYLIGMWICIALAEEFDLRLQWPNDLVLDRKKVCGVLTEVIDDVPIVGFGINIGPMSFPQDIAYRATSLANEGREVGSVSDVFDQILAMLNRLDEVPPTWREMAEKWRDLDETKGKIFRLQDGRIGIAEGVSDEAELVWNSDGTFEMITCADALWGINHAIETS